MSSDDSPALDTKLVNKQRNKEKDMSSDDSPAPDTKLLELLAWSRLSGGTLHDAVEIVRDDTVGLGLRVKDGRTLPADAVVVSCPLRTSLSYLSAVCRPLGLPHKVSGHHAAGLDVMGGGFFPDAFVEATPPHVVGRFHLMQQYLLGRDSAWWPYIQTLPQPDDFAAWALPAVWGLSEDQTKRARNRLVGTNAGTAASDMAQRLMQEHEEAIAAFEAAMAVNVGCDDLAPLPSPAAGYTFKLYAWAYCIFTSRSFRPSLVLPKELHEAVWQALPAETASLDEFSMLLPLLDLANHDPRAQVAWVPSILSSVWPPYSPFSSCDTPPSSSSASSSSSPSATDFRYSLCFVTRQSYAAGAQIYNNYGPKTNSELLLGYGFVLPPSDTLHNDYVHLRRRRGDDTAGKDTGSAAGTTAPTDFLLSLRPLHDPSSVAGASRQRTPTDASEFLPAAFAQFEDALLWDLCTKLWTDDEQKLLQAEVDKSTACNGSDTVDAQRRALLIALGDEDEKGPFAALAGRVRETLLDKVGKDYVRLVETDPYDDESDDEEDQGMEDGDGEEDRYAAFTQLTETYREQYRSVLVNAAVALDPTIQVIELD